MAVHPSQKEAAMRECSYCGSVILPEQRWVREKVYDSTRSNDASYHRYHAELFDGQKLSCWE
jgi:hypothetical protein